MQLVRAWLPTANTPTRIGLITISVLLIFATLVSISLNVPWPAWTGFDARPKDDTTVPEKTLWDWMGLLIVPLVLAIGGYIYNRTEKQAERDQADRRNQTERDIAEDNQREAALQSYLDRMSELLLVEKGLRDSKPEDEIRSVARSRTLTVLRRLDPIRKGNVIQFLYESNLITLDNTVVLLTGADLSGAILIADNLTKANLTGTFLAGAKLTGANLTGANLAGSILHKANFTGANLQGTILRSTLLAGADLAGADLTGADLAGAFNCTQQQLDTARIDANTKLPKWNEGLPTLDN